MSWLSKQLKSIKKRAKSTLKSIARHAKEYGPALLAVIPGPWQIPAAAALAVQGVRAADRAEEQTQEFYDALAAPLSDALPGPVPIADPSPPELAPQPLEPPVVVPELPPLVTAPQGPIPYVDYAPQFSGGGIPVSLPFVPPGGFFGVAQQTPAAQRAMGGVRKMSGSKRRRRKAKKAAAAPRRRRRSSGNKFRKGSAAAKRHMAKLRAMRKR